VGLTRRQWFLLGILAAALLAAGIVLGTVTRVHGFRSVGGLAAPLSLVISIVALIMSGSQTLSARRQAEYARAQTRYAGEQARLAALATANSYRPVLLPVHDAVPVEIDASAEPYFPALDAFTVPERSAGESVFLVDARQRRATIHIRNVGAGPAVITRGFLSDYAGRRGELEGNPAIGPDDEERFSVTTAAHDVRPSDFTGPSSADLRTVWQELVADPRYRDRVFLLAVHYVGLAPGGEVDVMEAVYDPRGTGRWRTSIQNEEPRPTDRGPGLLA
jgi:hypothetical protein